MGTPPEFWDDDSLWFVPEGFDIEKDGESEEKGDQSTEVDRDSIIKGMDDAIEKLRSMRCETCTEFERDYCTRLGNDGYCSNWQPQEEPC